MAPPLETEPCAHWGWRIDGPVPRRADAGRSRGEWVYCSPADGEERGTHVAKLLPETASEQQWLQLERQAYLAVKLTDNGLKLVFSRLTSPGAMLVHPRLSGELADEWVNYQAQWIPRTVWVTLAWGLLKRLQRLHQLGYVHGRLSPEHVWIEASGRIALLGLGGCALVGEALPVVGGGARYAAPERLRAGTEATSAQDIYSAALVIDLLSGGVFAGTPVGACMQAICPYDRPTAGELVELLASYLRELHGDLAEPVCRAA